MTSPAYRVLMGACRGQIVGADDVVTCERCDGERTVGLYDERYDEYERTPCPDCRGEGVVLGYGIGGYPTKVEKVTPDRSQDAHHAGKAGGASASPVRGQFHPSEHFADSLHTPGIASTR